VVVSVGRCRISACAGARPGGRGSGNVIARLPEQARPAVGMITRAAFTAGLNRILLVAAVIAPVSGAVCLAAVRDRDSAQQQGPGSPG
jgi:hypothetical protein